MPEELEDTYTVEDNIEDHIGLTQPDAFETTTSGDRETGKHLFSEYNIFFI